MNKLTVLPVCKNCKASCCKLGGPDFTREEMEKVLKAGHPNYFVELSPNHFELRSKNAICPYLFKDHSCSIHNQRPYMCKSWPIHTEHDGERKYVLIACPLAALLTKQNLKTMKRQASKRPDDNVINAFTRTKLSKSSIQKIERRYNKFKNSQNLP